MNLDRLSQIVAIEFPLKVENHERALDMIGGEKSIRKISESPNETLELRLRSDPFHHPISSRRADCENVVLEIDLPAWAYEQANGNLRRALALSKDDHRVVAKAIAENNHRFREMADFQYYTGDSAFVHKVKKSVLAADLDEMAKVELEGLQPIDLQHADVMPPPRFSQQPQPFFYNYKQNPSVAVVSDESGQQKLVNKATQTRIISEILVWGDPVPKGPPSELSSNPRPIIKQCIEELRELFQRRPSYTRRALEAEIRPDLARYLRYALPYVSYFYRSGPWRGAYIVYGHDPTTDPSFAIYQVEHFRLASDADAMVERPIYKFDGVTLPTTRMLQLCDISDQFLKMYTEPNALRTEPDMNDGWYVAETMAALRKVMRAKITNIFEKRPPLTTKALTAIAEDAIANAQKESEKHNSLSASLSSEDEDEDVDVEDE